MKSHHYKNKVYGIGHTRMRRILELAGTLSGRRVLDVGCSNGKLGALIRDLGNYVAGIEISNTAVAQARTVLDALYEFDIEHPWPSETKGFDRIILARILEHVSDPVAVLRQARAALADTGAIIITTPNFMTWTNRLRFIVGMFAYQEEGMFDFGHIRWFTYDYLKTVLHRAGFIIIEERHI